MFKVGLEFRIIQTMICDRLKLIIKRCLMRFQRNIHRIYEHSFICGYTIGWRARQEPADLAPPPRIDKYSEKDELVTTKDERRKTKDERRRASSFVLRPSSIKNEIARNKVM